MFGEVGIKKIASQNEKILISRSNFESKILKLRKTEVCDRGAPDVMPPLIKRTLRENPSDFYQPADVRIVGSYCSFAGARRFWRINVDRTTCSVKRPPVVLIPMRIVGLNSSMILSDLSRSHISRIYLLRRVQALPG